MTTGFSPATARRAAFMVGALLLLLSAGVAIRAAIPTWTIAGNTSAARTNALSFLLPDGTVLVVGGLATGTAADLATDRYNPATGTWSPGPPTLFAHPDVPAAVRLPDGRIMVTGGRYGFDVRSSAEIFSPATNTWSAITPMNSGRAGHTLTALPDGRVLAAGGWNGGFLNTAEVYSPASGVWTSTPAMGQAKWLHSATLLNDGRVLVAGGERYSPDSHFRETQYFDPGTGTWTDGPLLNTGRVDHEAALLSDGRVIVIGGLNGFGVNGPLASTEIYDGVSWKFGASMSAPRLHFPLVVMGDGTLLVTGGTDTLGSPQTALAGTERYDPSTNTWSNSGAMNSPRRFHTATRLANGRVLVAGGATATTSLLTSEIMGDTIAPVTTASPSIAPNGNGWNNSDVTVTLTAADAGGSGVQSIAYSLSGAQSGGATIAGATAAVTISSEGLTTIDYHAVDAEGNVEAGQTLAVRIDKTMPVLAPVANVTVPATAGGTVVNFTPSASDVPSGIVSISSSPRSGWRFPAGTTNVQVTALDAAGNAALTSFTVTVVPSAPVITVTGGDFAADGAAHPAAAIARDSTGAPVAGAFNIVYDPGGASAPAAPGRYSASATFTSADPGILSAAPWTAMAPDPNPKNTPAVAAINGKLYVYGFDQGATQATFAPRLSIYDPATNTWSLGASPNMIRAFVSAGVIDGKLYVAGGCVMSDCRIGITNALEIYDPVANSWSFGPAMTNGRFGAAAGVVAGRFVVSGGTRACPPCNISTATEVYDPVANTWSPGAPIPVSRELPASAVINGLLYVIGGHERNPANPSVGANTGRVDVYDPAANSWTTRTAMPSSRHGAAAGVVNGAIYVVGGTLSAVTTATESYDPVSDTWLTQAPMPTARSYVSAGVLNSKLYVIDGFTGVSHLGTNERFDPSLTARITISEPAEVAPTASFSTSPNPATCQQPVSFDGSRSSAGRPDRQIVSYAWDFGDGTVVTSGAQSVNHAYGGFGTYTATLTVTDNSIPALSATTSMLVDVSLGNQAPVANPGGPYSVDLGNSVQLNGAASSDANAACGDSIVSYTWTIDGSVVLNGASPMLNAAQIDALGVGSHNLSLRVTDEFGLSHTAATTLSIYNNVPTASFTATPNPVACDQIVSFTAFGSSAGRPDRQIVNYAWNFGDGSPIASGMASSLNHQYDAFGSYNATLTVTDNNVPAKSASTSVIIVVSQGNQPPQANAGGPYSASAGGAIQLNASGSSDPNTACGDSIVSYSWTIDGAIQLSGATPTLDLAAHNITVGSHSVSLRVIDEFGASSTSSTTLNVRAVLVSVSVSPLTASLNVGENQSFQAIGHYNDGTTRMLPSAGNGGGGSGGGFTNVPHWSVQFVSSQIDLSACATAQSPAPITFSSQAINDRSGVIDETWSPGTPVVTVSGTIDAANVNATLACTNSPLTGTITAQWTGTKYEGHFSFNGSTGTVRITGWSPQAPLPVARFSLAAAASGGMVYTMGGIGPDGWSAAVDAYNPATNTWTTVGEMSTPRSGAGAVALNGKIYVIGGHVAGGVASGLIEAYNPSSNTWDAALAPMPTPRAHVAVVTDGAYIYAIGGDTAPNNGGVVATVERYDPATNSWSPLASMPSAGNFLSAGVLNGTIVVAGGGSSATTDIYEIASNTWRAGPPMPAGRTLAAAAVANGGLYLVGGTVNGSPAHDAWTYYPATPFRPEYWAAPGAGPMRTGRSQLAAAVVDDVVYALGGMVPASNPAAPLAANETLSTPPVNTFAAFGGSSGSGSGGETLPTVEWQSTSPLVASVDNSGNAHAHLVGETTIVAVLSNGMTCAATNTCARLTVVDRQPPYLGLPNNQTREANSAAGATNVTYFASAYDSVDGDRPVACSPASGSTFPFGPTTVNCSASDLSGNTAIGSFTIVVSDTKPPMMNGPSGDLFRTATGPAGANVTWTITATDAVDGPRMVACNPASGSLFPLGPSDVTCTASDTRNNIATRTFRVIVQDTNPPFLNVPSQPLRQPATSAAGALVDFSRFVTAYDSVDGAVTPTCSPSSGSLFPIGSTTVSCYATDARNNRSQTKSFIVTVEDRPIVVVPANLVVEATSAAGASVPFTATATTFGTGPVPVSCVIITSFVDDEPVFGAPVASGSVFPLGTTIVGCLAMDEGELFTITVVDTVSPAVRLFSPLVDDFVATAPASVVVDVEVIEAVGIAGVTINGVNAVAAGSTAAGTLWRASVPGPASNTALTLSLRATDAAGHAGAVTAIIDNDGIAAALDRSRVSGADQRDVYSSEFNDGTTAGTITRVTGGKVTAVPSGAGVRIGMATAGIAHVAVCSGSIKYVVLDEQGESADVSCAAGGTVTVTAHTTGNGRVELYKSRPEDFFLAQLRCTFSFFLPLHLRYSPTCSPSPSAVSYYYSYQVKLKDGQTASTGSPVAASPDHSGPIEVTLLQIDDAGNQVPVADFELDPGESADVSVTPGTDRADHLLFSVLTGSVTFFTGGGAQTVGAGGEAAMTVDMSLPPLVVTTSGDATVEAASAAGAVATFTATAMDAGGTATDVTCSPASGSTFPIGDTTVTCASTDVYGSTGSATLTVRVIDTVAPAISGIMPSAAILQPPNHKMAPITIQVSASDSVDAVPVCTIAGVTSSEPANGLGDGDLAPDWVLTSALSVDLRAERAGNGAGRVYTIAVRCVDDSGNATIAVTQVSVAHDKGR